MKKLMVLTALLFVAGFTVNLWAESDVAGGGPHLTQNDKSQIAGNLNGDGKPGTGDDKDHFDHKGKVFPKVQFDHKAPSDQKGKLGQKLQFDHKGKIGGMDKRGFLKGDKGFHKGEKGFLKGDKGLKKYNSGKNSIILQGGKGFNKGETGFLKGETKKGKKGIVIEGKNGNLDAKTGNGFQKGAGFHKAGDALGAGGGTGMPAVR